MRQYGEACRAQNKSAWLATIHPVSLQAMQGEYASILEDFQQEDFDSFVESTGWEQAAPANLPGPFTVQPTLLATHRRGTKTVWSRRWLATLDGSLYLTMPEPSPKQAQDARSSISSRKQTQAEVEGLLTVLSPELKQKILEARTDNQLISAIKWVRQSHPKTGLISAKRVVYAVWRSQP